MQRVTAIISHRSSLNYLTHVYSFDNIDKRTQLTIHIYHKLSITEMFLYNLLRSTSHCSELQIQREA